MQNIDEIYKSYSKIVYKYLFCLTHNQDIAEELTQETFYVAVKDISKFRNECKIEVWLCQIAKFLWYKELKRKRKLSDYEDKNINFLDLKTNIEDDLIKKEEIKKLYKNLNKLDITTREVIKLRISSELSFKQIGEILGKNETWARVTFYRGKEKLKEVERNERQANL